MNIFHEQAHLGDGVRWQWIGLVDLERNERNKKKTHMTK
jgi:hypothetical protein